MASVQQIIGKINPLLYADNGKELLKKYKTIDRIPANEVKPKLLSEHSLVYDSSSETLEPVYFWILDIMNKRGLQMEKLVDNFSSTPGSGYFAELGQRATIMQQNASKIMGDINTVLRSVLSIVYDLKEFKTRLSYYDNIKSKDEHKREGARQILKQIWLDKVDIAKGNSSIAVMARQIGFQTLFDAFFIVKDEKDADKLDLNDTVKRAIKSRIQEFNIWARESEKELRKRYELERTYLKSQVNSLKLYARWAKPYLRAAHQLEMSSDDREPDLVKTFNTILLELTLLGKTKINIKDAAIEGNLPIDFKEMKSKRDYFMCILVDFRFRGIPQKAGQHYTFGGLSTVKFIGYALNSDEIKMLDKELANDDMEDILKLTEGATTESLGHMQDEINSFLEEKTVEDDEKGNNSSNPFLALIGHYEKSSESKKKKSAGKKEDDKKIRKDDWIEKNHLRALAEKKAKFDAFDIFDSYKQAHGMASFT
ncbi:hypothetical protein COU59_02925 [Candidatus Pacearchaeota archaeon CG10_big_fil_rev_8_21_14_0_10_34_12]|nr:MAG: hypothetical protein COU59_02925 [Candidatus Pacearchaeota archaeon CG10_big_fil_rev_8_21_14_0_10_34_12]